MAGLDDAAADELLDPGMDVGLRSILHPGDRTRPERCPDDGCILHQRSQRSRDPVEPGRDDGLDGRRRPELIRRRCRGCLAQHAREFDRVQRIAARPLQDRIPRRRRQRDLRQQSCEQLGRLPLGQRRE
jgi:hypothetical protein